MASVIYPKAKQLAMGLICGSGTRPTGTLKAALVDTNDVPYDAGHDYYDDISAAVVGTPVEITSPTFTLGVLDGANITWSSVTGDVSEAVVVYLDTGTPGTSPLIAFIDSGSGLPITPDGNNIACTWSGSGICAL
jgi:hypothetical protein